tara:strand:- start:3345 stop:3551 length:207 start_codon:yes stop_codon:yes gene_type:complete
MQKVINTLSIISFTAFLVGLGGLGYGFLNRQKIINHAMSQIKSELPKLVKESMPSMEMPKATGNVLPF